MRRSLAALGLLLIAGAPFAAHAASLTPTSTAFQRQVDAARRHALPHARTSNDLYSLVESGELVPVVGNGDFKVKEGTPFAYARPEMKLFLERIAVGYRKACGEQLVVTSLARPRDRQPRNASPQSVHPAGIAVDLRRSWSRSCRGWFEAQLLDLEAAGVIEAAHERRPPHYHVVVFPDPYLRHVGLTLDQAVEAVDSPQSRAAVTPTVVTTYRYVVQPGDSLWSIANRYGSTPTDILRANGLRSSTLRPGQLLEVPAGSPIESAGREATYRVRAGDNLWRIARRHGTSPRALQSENGLRSTRIYPGQLLRIPLGGS